MLQVQLPAYARLVPIVVFTVFLSTVCAIVAFQCCVSINPHERSSVFLNLTVQKINSRLNAWTD